MSFPNYKRVLFLFKVKDEWEDRGEVKGKFIKMFAHGNCLYKFIVCTICQNHLRVGLDTSVQEAFLYCPLCLKTFKPPEENNDN